MNKKDLELYKKLDSEISNFSDKVQNLPILDKSAVKDVLLRQMIDSTRRVKYPMALLKRRVSRESTEPENELFDPIRAAIYYKNECNLDESIWLIFLTTHFGYSSTCKWLLVKDVYGGVGHDDKWTWENVVRDLASFELWSKTLSGRLSELTPKRKFGNHRKYESLKYESNRALYKVVNSYIELISSFGGHYELFKSALEKNEYCKYKSFDYLFEMLDSVLSFGRTAKFDFLTMLGKLDIVKIEPPKTYMVKSTGPSRGAKLLFGESDARSSRLESLLFEMNSFLSIDPFGMQVLEDAICNWQKSTSRYVYFGG